MTPLKNAPNVQAHKKLQRTSQKNVDIVRVGVLPECRRQGIAKALLTHALNEQKGRVFLDVRGSNTPAIMLYKSLGFVDTGVRKNYYENPTENAVLMWREAEAQKTPAV